MCRVILVLNLGSGITFLNLFYPTLDPSELTFNNLLRMTGSPLWACKASPVPGGEGNIISAKE